MEHIVELLRRHGFEDVIVTVAFLPQAIRGYFGNGDALGIGISYSVEESPLGTAGSVRLAADKLDEPFLVISGDALCDLDLTRLVEFHSERDMFVVHHAEVVSEAAVLRRIREAGARHGRAYEPTALTSEIDNRIGRRT